MEAVLTIARELLGTTWWEAVGVITALLYLVLATRKSQWCWLHAFISSVCYVVVMWRAGLVMDTVLSVFYVVMAVYGWWQWQQAKSEAGEMQVVSWTLRQHVSAIGLVLVATVINAWALQFLHFARSPWLDSFVTWGSVLTTFMVARRVIENWLYWIVVDGTAAYLYFTRGLHATAALFVLYVFMVIYGYCHWRRQQPSASRVQSRVPDAAR